MPEAATRQTLTGAEAFTHHFVAQLNKGFNDGDGSGLNSLVLPTCKTCSGMLASLAEYRRNSWRFEGEYLHPTNVNVYSMSGSTAEVHMGTAQQGGKVLDAVGAVVTTAPKQSGDLALTLQFSDMWRVAEVKAIK